MQKLSDSDRLLKKCTRIISQSVDMLPFLLTKIDREIAAQIIANLAKSLVSATRLKVMPQEVEPENDLDLFVNLFNENAELESKLNELQQEKTDQSHHYQIGDRENYKDTSQV